MKIIDKNDGGGMREILHIFCADTVNIYDKLTFSSYLYGKIYVTHWLEDIDDADARITGMFDVLFVEMMERRKSRSVLPLKK